MQSSHDDLLERILHKNGWIGCIFIAMRIAKLSIWTLLVAVSVGFAQSGKPDCPTINVYGPAGITPPGEPAKFTVELKGTIPDNVEYKWKLSTGKILEGQGTNAITMVYDRDGSPVSATVELSGLPDGCPNNATDTLFYDITPVPELVAEGSIAVTSIDKVRLDKLAAELIANPGYQGYMIEYFPSRTTEKTIDSKTRAIRQYLKKSIDESRITIVIDTDSSAKPMTRYYIVPPGAMNPTP
jgi:hypothetical protein